MISLIRGQKIKLPDITDINQTINLQIRFNSPLTVDVASFGLNAQYRLSDERYMTFYNQPATPCGAIQVNNIQPNGADFQINLLKLDSNIQHIVFTLAVDGLGTMSQLKQSAVSLFNAQNVAVAEFQFSGEQFQQERALMLVELYKKDGVWRLAAVAQGFSEGLDALIRHFGGEVAEEVKKPTLLTTHQVPPIKKPSLSKISLNKVGQSHRLNLTKNEVKNFIVEAIWVDNGDGCDSNDDLDLRVGILIYGKKDMEYIFAPKKQGSLDAFPYIRHMGDVTSASQSEPATEKVEINVDIAKKIGAKVGLVFSVYSAVTNGMVSIASLQPKMKMQYGDQIIECVFNPSVSPAAKKQNVYTYVIGLAVIDESSITLEHSGVTSKPNSEDTPRLIWSNNQLTVKVDGEPFFK